MEQRTVFFLILALVVILIIIFMTTGLKEKILDIGRLFGIGKNEIENAITSMPFEEVSGSGYSVNADLFFVA